jgi:hypothetical protein
MKLKQAFQSREEMRILKDIGEPIALSNISLKILSCQSPKDSMPLG